MDRRGFLKFLAASPMIPAALKRDVIAEIKKRPDPPKFSWVELVETDSGTYPKRAGEKFWAYMIPGSAWAICADGRMMNKGYLRVIE